MLGFQTPFQAGSLPRSAQSGAVGAGLTTAGGFLGAFCASAKCPGTKKTASDPASSQCLMVNFPQLRPGDENHIGRSVHCEAGPATEHDNRHPDGERDRACKLRSWRGPTARAPSLDAADADQMKDRHVETGER